MTDRDRLAARLARNDESRNRAEHYREPWSDTELDVLALWRGGDDELADVAEMLGRTIEACRQRFYVMQQDPAAEVARRLNASQRSAGSQPEPAPRSLRSHWSDEDRADYQEGWYV